MADSDFTFKTHPDGTISITKYVSQNKLAFLQVPNSLFGKKITSIGTGAFSKNNKITDTIEISEGIINIEDRAFDECTAKHIIVPSSVTYIGNFAFANCRDLQDVKFTGAMPRIEDNIFSGTNPSLRVLYYATARGWETDVFGGRTTVAIDENADDYEYEPDENILEDEPEYDVSPEDDLFEYEEQEYKAEVKAYERVGVGATTATSLKHVANPVEAFTLRAELVFSKLAGPMRIDSGDFSIIKEYINIVPNIRFKNPAAFVVGYIFYKKGYVDNLSKTLDEYRHDERIRKFDKFYGDVAPIVNEKTEIISEIDVIRYGIFWSTLYSSSRGI